MSPGSALRALMAARRLVAAPGIADPMTAALVQSLGFECLYLGGNALGTQLCAGQPFVTLTETAQAVHRITAAVRVPLVVDAGAGFGEAAHVHRCVRELEHAGAAAIHIDDQRYPKSARYHKGQGELEETAAVSHKIRTAVEARRDAAFCVWARTDAYRVHGAVQAAVDRAGACLAAGADAVVVLDAGPPQMAELRAALPDAALVYIGGIKEPVPTAEQLQRAGFAAALYPFNTTAAIATAVLQAWGSFAAQGRPREPEVATAQTVVSMLELVGMDTYWAIEERGRETRGE